MLGMGLLGMTSVSLWLCDNQPLKPYQYTIIPALPLKAQI